MFAAFALAMLAATGAAPKIAVAPANATPAIFSIRDSDTTIFMFGTFHVLDSRIIWFAGPVQRAFEQSDELVVETIPPDRIVAGTPGMAETTRAMTPAANFLATTQTAIQAGQSQGMKLDSGADMVLMRIAADQGKPVEQLETIASQFAMLASMPPEPGRMAVPAAAGRVPMSQSGPAPQSGTALPEAMVQLQSAWASGEQKVFAALLNDMRTRSPDTYQIMFAQRNVRWANWVAARMRAPGTVFVAVGTGHLTGPDSLLVLLAQRGLISRRVR